VDKLRGCFVEEGIVTDVEGEGREKIPELLRVQGPRSSDRERESGAKVSEGGM